MEESQLYKNLVCKIEILELRVKNLEDRINNYEHKTIDLVTENNYSMDDSISSIDNLYLTMRSANCLRCYGISTIEQLVSCTKYDLLKIPNFGNHCLRNVEECLKSINLKLSKHQSFLNKDILRI
jgi:DNA-directed RNA polymerase alpha subunit